MNRGGSDVSYKPKKSQSRNVSASKRGEQAYRGKAAGSFRSATRRGERAWNKDISGHDLRKPSDPGIVQGSKGTPMFNAYSNKLKGQKRALGGRGSTKTIKRRRKHL